MYHARERYLTSYRQTGYYFSSHLRPMERVHLILGGRWAKDVMSDDVETDCLVDDCGPGWDFAQPLTNPVLRRNSCPMAA